MDFFYYRGEKIKLDPDLKLNVNNMHMCGDQCNDGTYRMRINGDIESRRRYMYNSKGGWIVIEGGSKCECDFSEKISAKKILSKLNEDYKNTKLDYSEQLADIIMEEKLAELKMTQVDYSEQLVGIIRPEKFAELKK